MNKQLIFATLTSAFVSFVSFSQQTICLGTDISVCVGTNVQIENCGSVGTGMVNSIMLDNPTTVNLSDDSWSSVVNIGFNFNFYGNTYSQCIIGSNGLISFNTFNSNGYCSWALTGDGPLPNTNNSDFQNAVMGCYQDINPGNGGQIFYKTIGAAPNREFYVVYANIPMFSSSECQYIVIKLTETSNQIEYHIGNKTTSGSGWNGSLAVQGVENAPGNLAVTTAGRNNSVWTCTNDGKLYTPTSPTNTNNYQVSTIPYLMVSSNLNYEWVNTLGQTFPYNNGILNVNNVQTGTIGYYLSVSASQCSSQIGAISDTSWITGMASSVSASSTPDICSSNQGTVTATPTSGDAPYTFNWPALGSTDQIVNNVGAGTYLVQMTDANGCSSTTTVSVGDTPANFAGSSTLITCPGGNDGTATATMLPALGTVTYLWDDPAAQTTATATGLTAGTYTCTITSSVGCTGTVTVTVDEISGLTGSFTTISDVTCNSDNDGVLGVTISQGTAPYSYSWDNSTSISNIANDLYAGTHTVTITDNMGCTISLTETIDEPDPLKISSMTPNTQICPEDEIELQVAGTGGSSTYTFTWKSSDGEVLGNGNTLIVDPLVTNTSYCVELTEACGSPLADSCVLIYFPTPVIPQLTPDKYVDCDPGEFYIQNTSANIGELATTYIDFGNNENVILQNGADTSVSYSLPGIYSLEVINTSIYGCVYDTVLTDFLTVNSKPIANFVLSGNPGTIYETLLEANDLSTDDVVSWEWFSPNSNPSHSLVESPKFKFPEGVEGKYPVTLVVHSYMGCSDTISKEAIINDVVLFYVPNTFTPDNDEFNQTWDFVLKGADIYGFNLKIFNRWGEIVWETNDPEVGWDGTYNGSLVKSGAYTWKATFKHRDDDGKKVYTGTVNVLR